MMKNTIKKTAAMMIAAVAMCAGAAFAEGKTIAPEPEIFSEENLENGIMEAAFGPEEIKVNEDGTVVMQNVSVFSRDMYDIVDIAKMEKGDKITVGGKEMVVETIEQEGSHLNINGGFEEGGATLTTLEDTNGWAAVEYNGLGVFTKQCTVDIPVDEKVVFEDSSDLTAGPAEVDNVKDAMELMKNEDGGFKIFNAYNTTITVEGGKVVGIKHVYVP